MENEEQMMKTRNLVQQDEELSGGSFKLGGQLGKNQENGSRVLGDGNIDVIVNGTGGNAGGGVSSFGGGHDDVPLKDLAKKGTLTGGEEEKVNNSGERVSVGRKFKSDRATEEAKCSGEELKKLASGDSNGGMSLRSLARLGRRSEFESGGQNASGDRPIDDVLGSISQRTRNRVITGRNEGVESVGAVEKANKVGDEGDLEHGFSVGDFVWGKIKSHPWWPGRIYDPSDASEFALKYKHEGRLLVAYFGDGTFAWCNPSQLQPFLENFDEMSKQSCSRNFCNAVEEAVKELGRLVEWQTMCSCSRNGSQSYLPQLVVNAGLKEGVVVPDSGAQMFSISQFKPAAMLAAIRHYATFDSVGNFLQVTALKSQLSAFYGAKGCFLAVYYDPLGIEGLMDEGELPGESTVKGPDDSRSQTPLDSSYIRKHKSITELLENAEMPRNQKYVKETKDGKLSDKAALKSGRRRKLPSEDRTDDDGSSKAKDEGAPKMTPDSRSRRQKVNDENQCRVNNDMMITRSITRTKGSAIPANTEKVSVLKDDEYVVKGQQKAENVSRGKRLNVSLSCDSNLMASERISPRVKKLSKYLSPPYTNLLQRQRFSLLQEESGAGIEFSDVAKKGERMSRAASKLVASPLSVSFGAESSKKSSKGPGLKHDKTIPLDNEKKHHNLSLKACGSTGGINSSNYVLQEIQSAALDPLHSRESQSFDSVKGFMSSYRISSYENGSNYNVDKKGITVQQKRKRNSSGTMLESDGKSMKKVKFAESEKGKSSSKSPTVIPDNQPLAVLFLREKLNFMTSLLPDTDGIMSEDIKSRLKNEAKAFLKNLKLMKTSS